MTTEHTHILIVICDQKLSYNCWGQRSYCDTTESKCHQMAYREGWREIEKKPWPMHSCGQCWRMERKEAREKKDGNGAAAVRQL